MPKAAKIRSELDALWKKTANVQPREVIAIARRLGRRTKNTGKEPTYVRHGWPPLTIPQHGVLKQGTCKSILQQLEEDLAQVDAAVDEDTGDDDTEDDHER